MLDPILTEWLHLGIRWLHVVAAIAWIGSSFYFVHLDLSLKKREGLPQGAGGEAWQVHGGGFYHMVKYLIAPARMPDELTWFKWEAYTTFLSGFALLAVVYYFSAELYLIDRAVLDMPPWVAVLVSVVGLTLGWIAYDYLCKSPLGRHTTALALVGFVYLVALAYGFTWLFSGRGALMQIGALTGTMMVANVFLVIIPNQKIVVADLIAGRTPDPALGATAKQRSLHNNYLTLPVVFVMIAGHFPLVFDAQVSWAIFALVMVISVLIRHFFNTRHKGEPSPWWTWFAVTGLTVLLVWLSYHSRALALAQTVPPAQAVEFAAAEEVVLSRCSMCHAAEPVWEGVAVPPKGVVLETPEQIRLHATQIGMQAVWSHAMPPQNITEITAEERGILAAWLDEGGRLR